MTSAWTPSPLVRSAHSADRPKVFPALDTLRFIGAAFVLVTHVAFQTGSYSGTLFGSLAARLDVGVAIFFVLSGFLLSRPYLVAIADERPAPTTGRYLWHRLIRIAPVYLLTVVLVLTLVPPSRGPFVPHWVSNLTLTSIYTDDPLPEGLTQMWSLATEVAFYLVLPLIMLSVVRMSRRLSTTLIVHALVVVMVAINLVWYLEFAWEGQRSVWLPAFLSWFAMGILGAHTVVDAHGALPGRLTRWIRRVCDEPVACFVLALAILLVVSTPLGGPLFGAVPTPAEAITKNLMYALIGALLVLPCAIGTLPPTLDHVLTHPVARYLGRISYGVFCLHLLVLYGVFHAFDIAYFDGHFWTVLLATSVGTLLAASAVHHLVEVPAQRLRDVRSGRKVASNEPKANSSAN